MFSKSPILYKQEQDDDRGGQRLRLQAAEALFLPMIARIEALAATPTAAAAEETAAVLSHMGAALQGMSMDAPPPTTATAATTTTSNSGSGETGGGGGLSMARLVLQRCAAVLQLVAGAWPAPVVADAMAALLAGTILVLEPSLASITLSEAGLEACFFFFFFFFFFSGTR
eukprot:COSAG05_NODE_8_length_40675_cov_148.837539_10_plen_171_part_00